MKHPVLKDRLRYFMANHSFAWLLGFALFCSLVYSLVMGPILYLNGFYPGLSLLKSVLYVFLQLYNLPLIAVDLAEVQGINLFIFSFNQVLSVIVPGIIFGTIVFKLFHHAEILTFKKRMNLYFDEDYQCKVLTVRFYTATQLSLTDVHMKAVLRVQKQNPQSGANYVVNRRLSCNDTWDFATPSVPRTIEMKLEDSDFDPETGKLIAVQGNPLHKVNEIWILVSGNIPQLDTSFTERHNYSLDHEVDLYPYGDIHVVYDQDPKMWQGWETFDQ